MPRQLPERLHVEPQIGETNGRFWLTVTLTKRDRTWTSPETMLAANDWDAARDEAAVKVSRLIALLGREATGREVAQEQKLA